MTCCKAAILAAVISSEGQAAVTDAARAVLARLRAEIAAARFEASDVDLALSRISDAVERQVRQSLTYSLRPVINATGVILHTNLGTRAAGGLPRWSIFETLPPDIRTWNSMSRPAGAASATCMSTGSFASC